MTVSLKFLVAGLTLASMPLFSQSVISAKAGLVHYVEGRVLIDGKAVQPKFGEFPEIKVNQTLRTEMGRVEVLLGPGTVLRMSENSEIRMVSNNLSDTRVEVLAGSVLVEAAELEKDSSVRLLAGQSSVELRKKGLYRIDSSPSELRVYEGEALVTLNGETSTVKGSRRTSLEGAIVASKFDNDTGDSFYRWAGRRAGSLAAANLASAKSVYDSDLHWNRNGWVFNPFLGSYTYLPMSGSYFSPFGYRYYSPRVVGQIYNPPPMNVGGGMGAGPGRFEPTYNPNLGYNTAARSIDSGGRSAAAAPATAAPSGDGGGGGGSVRGGEGGGQSSGGRGR